MRTCSHKGGAEDGAHLEAVAWAVSDATGEEAGEERATEGGPLAVGLRLRLHRRLRRGETLAISATYDIEANAHLSDGDNIGEGAEDGGVGEDEADRAALVDLAHTKLVWHIEPRGAHTSGRA